MVKGKEKKHVSGVPPPPENFRFVCETCGAYPVTEEDVRRYITPTLNLALSQELQAGAAGAELTFKGGRCPRCNPGGVYCVELAALWQPKVH
jgi:hypothetical protein